MWLCLAGDDTRGVSPSSSLATVLFNISVNDLDAGDGCAISKFVSSPLLNYI